jgi:hypothetical protein
LKIWYPSIPILRKKNSYLCKLLEKVMAKKVFRKNQKSQKKSGFLATTLYRNVNWPILKSPYNYGFVVHIHFDPFEEEKKFWTSFCYFFSFLAPTIHFRIGRHGNTEKRLEFCCQSKFSCKKLKIQIKNRLPLLYSAVLHCGSPIPVAFCIPDLKFQSIYFHLNFHCALFRFLRRYSVSYSTTSNSSVSKQRIPTKCFFWVCQKHFNKNEPYLYRNIHSMFWLS